MTLDYDHRQIQRSRQFCRHRCCCFIEGQSVSMVAYIASRKGQPAETQRLETCIPCLNRLETQERMAKTGIYMGLPMGAWPDPYNFSIFMFDASTHLFIRDATVEEYEAWGNMEERARTMAAK